MTPHAVSAAARHYAKPRLTPFQETLTIAMARTKLCLRYIERGNPRARCHLNALMQDWLRTSEDLSP